MRFHRSTLCVAPTLLLVACNSGPTPSNGCVPHDYLVSDAVHPFTATYGGHCAGRYYRDVYETVFRTQGEDLFFQGTTAGESYGLWVSDGTSAGTRLWVSSTRYETSAEVPFVWELLPMNGGAFFFMDTLCLSLGAATPLWWTDGRDAVELVLGNRHVRSMVRSGETLFIDTDAPGSPSLWAVSLANRQPHEVARFGRLWKPAPADALGVVFSADSRLWFSDGSTEGTHDLGAGCDPVLTDLVVVGGKAYFACGGRLWAGDLSSRETQPVPGGPTTAIPQIWGLIGFGGRLAFFFRPVAGQPGASLWMTDGTEAGTQAIASLQMPSRMTPAPTVVAHGLLYFFVGDALWRSDGTAGGTRSVAQLTPRATDPDRTYSRRGPRALAEVGSTLYVLTNEAELWQIDAAGGHALAIDGRVSHISAIAGGRSRLFYAARGPDGDASLPILQLRAWGCPAAN